MDTLPFDMNAKIRAKNNYQDLMTISIDPKFARERDDAISIEKSFNGSYRLGIHIADLAARIPVNHKYDKLAKKNTVSYYDPYTPMLPKEITKLFSLDEKKQDYPDQYFFEINKDGSIAKKEFIPTTIKLNHNLNYEDFDNDLKNLQLSPTLNSLLKLKKLMTQKGHLPKGFFYEDEEDGISGEMIAFYMILTNRHTAEHLLNEGVNGVRRAFYSKKNLPKYLGKFSQYLSQLGMAFYTIGNHPHECLKLEHYLHSTSPIRRYADILVQRQLHAMDNSDIKLMTPTMLRRGAAKINKKKLEDWLLVNHIPDDYLEKLNQSI